MPRTTVYWIMGETPGHPFFNVKKPRNRWVPFCAGIVCKGRVVQHAPILWWCSGYSRRMLELRLDWCVNHLGWQVEWWDVEG